MSSIKVEGVGRLDGTYDLGDNDRVFNGREWHWIKQISGYMPGTISEGFAGQDPDLFYALAVIAMCRSGKVRREDAVDAADEMKEAPYTASTITLIGDMDEEADELPPPSEGGNDASSLNGSPSSTDTRKPSDNSSGTSSMPESVRSGDIPARSTV
jgi:hypothetical protein